MPRKPVVYKPTPPCEHCGGIHIGSVRCPYLAGDPGGHIEAHQAEKRNEYSEDKK